MDPNEWQRNFQQAIRFFSEPRRHPIRLLPSTIRRIADLLLSRDDPV